MDKPFLPTDKNIITCIVDENGDVIYLATDANDAFLNDGTEVTKRASHVEPSDLVHRIAFRFLRLFGDKTRIAEWTRNWSVLWRVDTRPVGGPILKYWDIPHQDWQRGWLLDGNIVLFPRRQDAIDAEIKFLNNWFLERGIA